MYENREDVRDIDIRVRLSPKEYRKLCAATQTRGLQFAAGVRALALEQAEFMAQQHETRRTG